MSDIAIPEVLPAFRPSARLYAIWRQVWKLEEEEIQPLSKFFILRVTGKAFFNRCSSEDRVFYLPYKNYRLELVFMPEEGLRLHHLFLPSERETIFVVSVRVFGDGEKLAVALVRREGAPPKPGSNIVLLKD